MQFMITASHAKEQAVYYANVNGELRNDKTIETERRASVRLSQLE